MKTDTLFCTNKRTLAAFLVIAAFVLSACGASEGAAGNRGRYVTGQEYIYQPEEIRIDSLIAKEDFNYPAPLNDPIRVTADFDLRGDTGFIQIGLKAKKDDFENLRPLNICFVIDISGSMADRDKLSWVKNAFYIFINSVRPNDIVSVVIFDNIAEVLVPPMSVKTESDRNQFKRSVDSLWPRGSTDILKGMNLGYEQVEKNLDAEYVNRVLLLTDGMHNGIGTKTDIINVVKRYNALDINISTIALGLEADIGLAVDMAAKGGGSSRFISDYDEMLQAFGAELDRLVAPAARSLDMTLELAEGVRFLETWGYENKIIGDTIKYSLETIHNCDYETLFAVVGLGGIPKVETKIATFTVDYVDANGYRRETERHDIFVSLANLEDVDAITNARVRKAEGYAAYGNALIEIGASLNAFNSAQKEYRAWGGGSTLDRLVSYLKDGMETVWAVRAYLEEINAGLGVSGYSDELATLSNYAQSFAEVYEQYTDSRYDPPGRR